VPLLYKSNWHLHFYHCSCRALRCTLWSLGLRKLGILSLIVDLSHYGCILANPNFKSCSCSTSVHFIEALCEKLDFLFLIVKQLIDYHLILHMAERLLEEQYRNLRIYLILTVLQFTYSILYVAFNILHLVAWYIFEGKVSWSIH